MHRSLDTLRSYVRRVDLFKEHAGVEAVNADDCLRPHRSLASS
jgi:hypothetical protein